MAGGLRAGGRTAEPGRPEDVPGLAMLPEGVCGRPEAALYHSVSTAITAALKYVAQPHCVRGCNGIPLSPRKLQGCRRYMPHVNVPCTMSCVWLFCLHGVVSCYACTRILLVSIVLHAGSQRQLPGCKRPGVVLACRACLRNLGRPTARRGGSLRPAGSAGSRLW